MLLVLSLLIAAILRNFPHQGVLGKIIFAIFLLSYGGGMFGLYWARRKCFFEQAGPSRAAPIVEVPRMRRARTARTLKKAGIAAIFFAFCALTVAAQQKQPPAHPLDLNVANVKELEQVPGIGSKTAQAIVDFRQKSGRFRRVEELLAIKGISQKKLDKLRPYLKVTPPPPPPPHKSPQP
jgi:competence ComEA-like helix-hairpin-helix protein